MLPEVAPFPVATLETVLVEEAHGLGLNRGSVTLAGRLAARTLHVPDCWISGAAEALVVWYPVVSGAYRSWDERRAFLVATGLT